MSSIEKCSSVRASDRTLPTLDRAPPVVNENVLIGPVNGAAAIARRGLARVMLRDGGSALPPRGRAPRPRPRPGDGSGMSLVLMGGPASFRTSGPRTFVRHCPSTRIPLPSHAAAAACLSTSGPPAFRHPPRHALPVLRARPGSLPVTRDTSRHDLVTTETPDSSPGSAVIPRASVALLAVGGMPPSARYRECGVRCLCDASTAYCCAAAAEARAHLSVLHNAGHFVRPRRPRGDNVIAGHLNTASSRRHQQSS